MNPSTTGNEKSGRIAMSDDGKLQQQLYSVEIFGPQMIMEIVGMKIHLQEREKLIGVAMSGDGKKTN